MKERDLDRALYVNILDKSISYELECNGKLLYVFSNETCGITMRSVNKLHTNAVMLKELVKKLKEFEVNELKLIIMRQRFSILVNQVISELNNNNINILDIEYVK